MRLFGKSSFTCMFILVYTRQRACSDSIDYTRQSQSYDSCALSVKSDVLGPQISPGSQILIIRSLFFSSSFGFVDISSQLTAIGVTDQCLANRLRYLCMVPESGVKGIFSLRLIDVDSYRF